MTTKIPHYKWTATTGESDWTVATNWSPNGVPNGDVDATFQNAGTFQCDITTAVDVQGFEVKVAGATLVESGAGFITAETLIMTAGRLELDGPNDFHVVQLETGAVIELGDVNAFGPRTTRVFFSDGGALEFTANMTFHPELSIFQGGIARIGASAGHTVNLAGEFDLGVASGGTEIDFGGDGDTGTVKLAGKVFGPIDSPQFTIDILSGTVINGSSAADVVGPELFAQAQTVGIESGATLDVRQFGSSVSLTGLSGAGTIISAGNQLALTGAEFDGTFTGNPHITATGTNSLGATFGHAFVTMGAGTDMLDVSQATGKVSVSAPSGTDATVVAGAHAPVYFTDFSAGHVTAEVLGAADATFSFVAGSGFTRVVVHDHGVQANLYLYGVTESDIHTADDGHGNLLVTVEAGEIAAHQSFVPMPYDGLF